MGLSDWSATAANNSTVLGVNIAENCPAANMNNALRQAMADVAGGINMSVLADFLASSSLSSARSALGVSGGSTSSNNFGNLTNVANKVPYMTGSEAWSTTDFTSFGRQVVATGDAAALLALLGTGGGGGISGSASSGYVSFNFSGTVFKFQWIDGTAAAEAATVINYPSAFSSWSRAICTGGNAGDINAENNNPFVSATSTTGATVVSARESSAPVTILAWGV